MGAKTPVTDLLELPPAGGAISGLGETFSPDLFTGTGNFTVPLWCPPGRAGLQPALSLAYGSGNGNGPFGFGWRVPVPNISRQTSRGVPRYADADTFVLSGVDDLLRTSASGSAREEYQPRTEGTFARIFRHRDSGRDDWEVQSRDGLISRYLPGIADPAAARNVFRWDLASTSDPFGNVIEYAYRRDNPGVAGRHAWSQSYLTEIRYVNYDKGGAVAFLYTIRFVYDARPDAFSDYRAGFEIRTAERCRRIEVRLNDGAGRLVRTHELTYFDDEGAAPQNGASLLKRIAVVGHGDATTQALPPVDLLYTEFAPTQLFGDYHRDLIPVTGADTPAFALSNPDAELVDLSGDGIPDVVETGPAGFRYWENLGREGLAHPRIMERAPTLTRLSTPGVQLLDADGDGRPDLFSSFESLPGFFPLSYDGEWETPSFQRSRAPSVSLADPQTRLIDLDGDGLTDILRTGSRFECFFNDKDPREAWRRIEVHDRQALEDFPDVEFSDARVRTADMTGDGLQDIVFFHDRCVAYWPNLGHGRWGKRITMAAAPALPLRYDPDRLLLGDFDGDGATDLAYVHSDKVSIWINRSGNSWSDEMLITGTPLTTNRSHVRTVDWLGCGASGVLWSYDKSSCPRESMYFLDLTGGVKPYLLHQVDNNLGAQTRIRYKPSTADFLNDRKDRRRRWRTKLPFPVQVVSQVQVFDELSHGKLTSEFKYRHGYWDGTEREFRGFGCVERIDSESFEDFHGANAFHQHQPRAVERTFFSKPVLTRTWFHLGCLDQADPAAAAELDLSDEYWSGDPKQLINHTAPDSLLAAPGVPVADRRDAIRALRGSFLRSELYTLDDSPRRDKPYMTTESCYSVRAVRRGDAGGASKLIAFPHVDVQRNAQWERGDDPMVQYGFTSDYDEFGQPRVSTTTTMPRLAAKRQTWTAAVIGDFQPDETRILAVQTRSAYATAAPGSHVRSRVAQTRSVELVDPPVGPDNRSDPVSVALASQWQAARSIVEAFRNAPSRVIAHEVHHYDGDPFVGLDPGQLGTAGGLTRSEALMFTRAQLSDALVDVPSYLGGNAPALLNAPAGFGSNAGYRFAPGSAVYESAWYADTHRAATSATGLTTALRDALGNTTRFEHDAFELLPIQMTNAADLKTSVAYDYRFQEPVRKEDPNGTVVNVVYSPLGLVDRIFTQGTDSAGNVSLGGSAAQPDAEYEYALRNFVDSRKPAYVHAKRRVDYGQDVFVELREYSDGFNRVLQTRTLAEPVILGETGNDAGLTTASTSAATDVQAADRVVVSGWQTYDNKGKTVERYEPFFAEGWEFQPEEELGLADRQKVAFFYDPRGGLIRTLNPDGSETRVIFGRPLERRDLALDWRGLEPHDVPAGFEPTVWETYTYDSNDLAPLTHAATTVPAAHHFTPASALADGLGRALCQVRRNGPDPGNDWFATRTAFDSRGNPVLVQDAMGRHALRHAYDLANRRVRVDSIDAGARIAIYDAAGNVIETRDAKGAATLRLYDALGRTRELWACDRSGDPLTLRETVEYGDDGDRAAARSAHTLLRAIRHFDGAGLLRFPEYDFKGNAVTKIRRTILDAAIESGWAPDWSAANAESALEAAEFRQDFQFDALNRLKLATLPSDVAGGRKTVVPRYNRGGLLDGISLDADQYLKHVAYNARRDRVLVGYGNGVMTRYAYDPRRFCLVRIRTDRLDGLAPQGTWAPSGDPIQDFTYSYDLAGNITAIDERTKGCGYVQGPGPAVRDRLTRQFTYDPVYRLRSATGRACRLAPSAGAPPERCGFAGPGLPAVTPENVADLTEGYRESYDYDPAGNLLSVDHDAGSNPWRKRFAMGGIADPADWRHAPNNRLTATEAGSVIRSQTFDPNGNLLTQDADRRYDWDFSDRMTGYHVSAAAAPPSVKERYLYDSAGMRVKKWVRNQQGHIQTSVYIDDAFEYHTLADGARSAANNYIHIECDGKRIAIARVGGPLDPAQDSSAPVQYHLGDHLGNSHTVVGGDRADSSGFINREEYFPYGETSVGSFARKRFRFGAKERDEHSGLIYFGARYASPDLFRWMSVDAALLSAPRGSGPPVDWLSGYGLMGCDPLRFIDPTGNTPMKPEEVEELLNEVATRYSMAYEETLKSTAAMGLREAIGNAKTQKAKDEALGRYLSFLGRETEELARGSMQRKYPGLKIKSLPFKKADLWDTQIDIHIPKKEVNIELKLSRRAFKGRQQAKQIAKSAEEGFAYALVYAKYEEKGHVMAKWSYLDADAVKAVAKEAGWTRKAVTIAKGANIAILIAVAAPYVYQVAQGDMSVGEAAEAYARNETVGGLMYSEAEEALPEAVDQLGDAVLSSESGTSVGRREDAINDALRP